MTAVTYQIVPHDGGWAYTMDGVFSETFFSHEDALAAARIAAAEHQVGGDSAEIDYQDAAGRWRHEHADGGDRPEAHVVDVTDSRASER